MTKRIYLKRGLCACIAGVLLLAAGCKQPVGDHGGNAVPPDGKENGQNGSTETGQNGGKENGQNSNTGTGQNGNTENGQNGGKETVHEFFSVDELKNFLADLPVNTADAPYQIKIGNVDLSSKETSGETLRSLYNVLDRYVTLDLSGCTGASLVSASTLPTLVNRKNIVSMTLPGSVIEIENSGFSGYSALISVSMPKVTKLGYAAFKDCGKLKFVSAPELTTLTAASAGASAAFGGCSSLMNVYFPKAERIGAYSFYDCDGLVSVDLPVAKYVENMAFKRCDNLETVKLPLVTEIGNEAFNEDTALRRLTFGAEPPALGSKPFATDMPSEGIYVPAGAVAKYEATSLANWSKALKGKVTAIK
ncbi:hypothetical protein AGMMS50267_11120 [Spirochaetia bacterium]|nr:hypothetical protein AGMMS50267_11120 [Spirochaetia bacterium]